MSWFWYMQINCLSPGSEVLGDPFADMKFKPVYNDRGNKCNDRIKKDE